MLIQVDRSFSWKSASYLNTKSKCNGMCINARFLLDQETSRSLICSGGSHIRDTCSPAVLVTFVELRLQYPREEWEMREGFVTHNFRGFPPSGSQERKSLMLVRAEGTGRERKKPMTSYQEGRTYFLQLGIASSSSFQTLPD